jgi:protein-S-isoprenylcysteine O-methyltransferase Ste14
MTTDARIGATILFLVYFSAAFAWPTWRVWRLTGRSPYVLPNSDDAYGFVTRGFRFVMVLLASYLLVQAFLPSVDGYLGALPWFGNPLIQAVAWSVMGAAFLWTVVAQRQMGLSWRIGIDQQRSTALVTSGLFRYSRNPIFLAMRASLLGLMLLLPNVVTVAAWLLGDLLMQLQVRLEEAYLSERHGMDYNQYRASVRRWI